jgi:prevent-host-death family protein
MAPSIARNVKSPARNAQPAHGTKTWKLEDAKARFSEVVRMAATHGPQLVTIRGKEAAVILAPEEYRQLLPKPKDHQPLMQFFQGLDLSDDELDRLDLTREPDTGRDLEL